ncbi:ParB N-terminal domain-containing protein [Lachnospiraceae bacterium WCA-9-b2]|jgi:ParB family chromosome partitioning protein|uniref:ParB N-terminal domain-containing protein n=1 Tax=Sporofaciens musculi TaxID=2681861 RepID=A0A7X3SLE5_9FIRM|nr:ParB N-terminal domain-containing protein [Sporofaciens musculi]MDE6993737.1 ParB N-terminal domain-containing protein [Lachnospiraceae bacterium]MXP78549.1 ParB N-terminal domain-containing protein [Sporofaciens musculi]
MRLSIKEIQVKEGRRSLDTCHVGELADSIREIGLLNPLTIDRDNFLIAGLHRLEAVKRLGWTEVDCTVSSLEGLAAELAEIDENIVRSDMSTLEYGEILLRRKEIYETLHPETKRGMRNGQTSKSDKMSFLETKSFAQDTAEKLGVVPRTVERQIQTAKNLTQEAKEIIKNADKKISKKEALKLSRLEPEDQKEAARLLTTQQIRNMGEYAEKKKEEPEKAGGSLKDMIAELKDPDKDCSGTPDSFLEEYEAFVRKFHKEIGWYSDPYYDTVFPFVSPEQLSILRELTDSICAAAGQLLHKVERTMKT